MDGRWIRCVALDYVGTYRQPPFLRNQHSAQRFIAVRFVDCGLLVAVVLGDGVQFVGDALPAAG